jgi:hypothetical protein
MNDIPDNVIALRSKKSLAETEAAELEAIEKSNQAEIATNLAWFDKIRENIAAGHFTMPFVIAYAPDAGLFLCDFVAPESGISASLAREYMAQLELAKLSMAEIASMGPVLQVDGSILDQTAAAEAEPEGEGDE